MGFFGGFANAMGDEAQKHLDQMTGEENDQRKNISEMYWTAIRNPETSDEVREHAFSQLEGLYRSPQAKQLFKQLREAYTVGKSAHDQYHAQPGQGMPKPPALLDKNAPAYGSPEAGAAPAGAEATPQASAAAAPAAAAAAPKGLPAPPDMSSIQDVTHQAYPSAETQAHVATHAQQASRLEIAKSIGIAPKPGEEPGIEFQRFMATGTMPASVSLQLLGDRVPGKNVPASAITTDGSAIDPNGFYRLQREPYQGIIIATAASATAGEMTGQQFSYRGPNGEPLIAIRYGNTFVDQQGGPLPPNTEVFVGSMLPTTSSTQTTKFMQDKDGNWVQMPVTSVTQRTPGLPPPPGAGAGAEPAGAAAGAGAGAAATPTPVQKPAAVPKAGVGPATPVNGPDGEPLHKPLSADAKRAIGQATISLDLLDQIMPELDAIATGKDKNNLWDSAQQRSAWEQYTKLGIDPANVSADSIVSALPNIDPRLAKLLPTIAMLQVVGAQPWLRNIRRFEFLQQVQQHLPNPDQDTPQLMLSKLDTLSQNMPNLIRAAYEEEGIKAKPYKDATVAEVQAFAAKSGQKYSDVAHSLRQGGYRITRGEAAK